MEQVMRSNVFVGGGCKRSPKPLPHPSQFAKIVNPKAPVKLSPETMIANLVSQRTAAERLRDSMIRSGLVKPVEKKKKLQTA
jgi:hypothetical protein